VKVARITSLSDCSCVEALNGTVGNSLRRYFSHLSTFSFATKSTYPCSQAHKPWLISATSLKCGKGHDHRNSSRICVGLSISFCFYWLF